VTSLFGETSENAGEAFARQPALMLNCEKNNNQALNNAVVCKRLIVNLCFMNFTWLQVNW
jgi:hypothetical protein